MSPRVYESEEENTVPGRQGQRPEYQEEGSGGLRLSGWRGLAAFSAQGTRVLKHPRLCLSRRAPSRSHGLLGGGREEGGQRRRNHRRSAVREGDEWRKCKDSGLREERRHEKKGGGCSLLDTDLSCLLS